MAVKSTGRKLSFEILSSFEDDTLPSIRRSISDNESPRDNGKRRRHRRKKKKKNNKFETIPEIGDSQFSEMFENILNYFGCGGCVVKDENPPFQQVENHFPTSETNGRLDTEPSLDWKQLMSDHPDCKFSTFILWQ